MNRVKGIFNLKAFLEVGFSIVNISRLCRESQMLNYIDITDRKLGYCDTMDPIAASLAPFPKCELVSIKFIPFSIASFNANGLNDRKVPKPIFDSNLSDLGIFSYSIFGYSCSLGIFLKVKISRFVI